MKYFLSVLIALFVQGQIIAQTPLNPQQGDTGSTQVITAPDAIDPEPDTNPYMWAEEPPMFPGGDSAWKVYLKNNLKYPTLARDSAQKGTVYVQFVVESDGSITNCIVRKHPNSPALAAEALRVVCNSPKWIPGKMNGKPVRVQMTMPIKFVLPE